MIIHHYPEISSLISNSKSILRQQKKAFQNAEEVIKKEGTRGFAAYQTRDFLELETDERKANFKPKYNINGGYWECFVWISSNNPPKDTILIDGRFPQKAISWWRDEPKCRSLSDFAENSETVKVIKENARYKIVLFRDEVIPPTEYIWRFQFYGQPKFGVYCIRSQKMLFEAETIHSLYRKSLSKTINVADSVIKSLTKNIKAMEQELLHKEVRNE